MQQSLTILFLNMLKRSDESPKLLSPLICDAVMPDRCAIVGRTWEKSLVSQLTFPPSLTLKKSKTSEVKLLSNNIKGKKSAKNDKAQDTVCLLWH